MSEIKVLRSSLSAILQARRMTLTDLRHILKQRGRILERKRLLELQNMSSAAGKLNIAVVIEVCDALNVNLGELLKVEKEQDEARLRRIATYRFPAAKQRRMDDLLDKGNAGKLGVAERRELEELMEEVEERTLQKALAMDALRKRKGGKYSIAFNGR